ncbi:hypothetical protein [Mycolicibacterium mucogenicum]|nr:hypothetical protein [Mycolicibacterium mucogenicum]
MTRHQMEIVARRRRTRAVRNANFEALMRPDDYRSRSILTSNRVAA